MELNKSFVKVAFFVQILTIYKIVFERESELAILQFYLGGQTRVQPECKLAYTAKLSQGLV